MEELLDLSRRLGHQFADLELLQRALTHRSFVNESSRIGEPHNERLEFLGDAVVNLVVSDTLMKALPELREGDLSRLRASIVSTDGLSRAGHRIELGNFIRLGRGEQRSGGRRKSSIVADALEAVVGAVYLDAGFEPSRKVTERLLQALIAEAVDGGVERDSKTRLQERVQASLQQLPSYQLIGEHGPDHAKVFEVAVSIDGSEVARASGPSKKQAEQRAAAAALSTWNLSG